MVARVERTDRHAYVEFDWGHLLLTATATELILRVQAEDAQALVLGQELIERRIQTISRRDQLIVRWQPRT